MYLETSGECIYDWDKMIHLSKMRDKKLGERVIKKNAIQILQINPSVCCQHSERICFVVFLISYEPEFVTVIFTVRRTIHPDVVPAYSHW